MRLHTPRLQTPRLHVLVVILLGTFIASSVPALGQSSAGVSFAMPKSHNPLGGYLSVEAPQPQLTNSPRLNQLIRDGKLYLSLKDAIQLA